MTLTDTSGAAAPSTAGDNGRDVTRALHSHAAVLGQALGLLVASGSDAAQVAASLQAVAESLHGLEQAISAEPATPPTPPADPDAAYRAMVDAVRQRLLSQVPAGGRVAVISRGDPQLTDLPGRQASHFPQTATGAWSGHYPQDGAQAAAHLDEIRRRGVTYLAVPATSAWWLDHYQDLASALEREHRLVLADDQLQLWALTPLTGPAPRIPAGGDPFSALIDAVVPPAATRTHYRGTRTDLTGGETQPDYLIFDADAWRRLTEAGRGELPGAWELVCERPALAVIFRRTETPKPADVSHDSNPAFRTVTGRPGHPGIQSPT